MRFYGNIQKVDAEQRMVYGYASTEAVDAHGEVIQRSAIEAALDDYMEFANIREMHQLSAVGTAEEASVDDKGLYLGAKVVDDTAWGKVTSGVYKGFSVGGKVLARDPDDKKIITKILLTEISLVDRPSNPEARFDVWKAAGPPQEDASMAKTKKAAELPLEADGVKVTASGGDSITMRANGDVVIKAATVTLGAAADVVADDVAKTAEGDGGTVLAAEAASEGDTVAKADDAAASDDDKGSDEQPAVDPLTKATEALDKIDTVVAQVTKPDDVQKGLYAVGRFAELLESIGYLASSAEYEAETEADSSPIPAKLRDWLKAGAAIFKDMAKEEVDELVAAGKVKKAAGAEAITGDAAGEDLTKVSAERDSLAKALTDKDEALAKLADRIEPLAKAFEELAAANADLVKRLEVVEAQPAEAKTAGALASISKEQDAGGSASLEKSMPSNDEVVSLLGSMTEEERALTLIKASRQLPRPVTYR